MSLSTLIKAKREITQKTATEQYKALLERSDAPLEGDAELLATVLSELGLTIAQYEQDVETVKQIFNLQLIADDLGRRQEETKRWRDIVVDTTATLKKIEAEMRPKILEADEQRKRWADRMFESQRAIKRIADLQTKLDHTKNAGAPRGYDEIAIPQPIGGV